MHHIYMGLLSHKTVQESFDIALNAVAVNKDFKKEANKFVLLPADKDHKVRIFNNVQNGSPEISKDNHPQNLISIFTPVPYQYSQSMSLFRILKMIRNKRLLTVCGERGIGKTTLLLAAASYLWRRGRLDGVFYIDFKKFDDDSSLARYVSERIMEAPYKGFSSCEKILICVEK
eukprot:TRINITY_DN8094_c0_g1_i1.p1 TRINITY_DN8094_c0_g1~~TRINITY_DN8094_c0_g1_i1.p1  ORF type:complete len:204 (+),score=26.68 TRINITY_DN8094_c0_g1_i1:91-612(+)